ncbi:hypothetical protein RUM44_012399 [Polyplax serrata]|uniref:Uncharacterized protein n=1 Tax=Polyplax serrata TaxID=468196 RepID=A0ABR1BBI9_POLSC
MDLFKRNPPGSVLSVISGAVLFEPSPEEESQMQRAQGQRVGFSCKGKKSIDTYEPPPGTWSTEVDNKKPMSPEWDPTYSSNMKIDVEKLTFGCGADPFRTKTKSTDGEAGSIRTEKVSRDDINLIAINPQFPPLTLVVRPNGVQVTKDEQLIRSSGRYPKQDLHFRQDGSYFAGVSKPSERTAHQPMYQAPIQVPFRDNHETQPPLLRAGPETYRSIKKKTMDKSVKSVPWLTEGSSRNSNYWRAKDYPSFIATIAHGLMGHRFPEGGQHSSRQIKCAEEVSAAREKNGICISSGCYTLDEDGAQGSFRVSVGGNSTHTPEEHGCRDLKSLSDEREPCSADVLNHCSG